MSAGQPCDLAVWDVGGALTTGLLKRLERSVDLDGPKIAVRAGDLQGRRAVVGWPQRLIARQAPAIEESLQALYAAHRPGRSLVVGPAAAVDASLGVGAVVAGDRIATGAVDGDRADIRVTTDWAATAYEAFRTLGVEGEVLAVVTRPVGSRRRQVRPPASNRPTISREAGRLLGSLLTGSTSQEAIPAVAVEATTKAILAIVRAD